MEQVHRLLVGDAEAAPEGVAVGREGVAELRLSNGAQALPQVLDVRAEAGRSARESTAACRETNSRAGGPLRRLGPEHLRERDLLPERLVAEPRQED